MLFDWFNCRNIVTATVTSASDYVRTLLGADINGQTISVGWQTAAALAILFVLVLGVEAARAERWATQPKPGTHDYGASPPANLSLSEFAYSGTWEIDAQPATAIANAGIDVEFEAKNVYLVLSSPGELPLPVHVELDGRPIPAADAGADVHDGVVTVRRQRLYSLVSLPSDQRHHLALRFAPGVSGYAFTFG